MIQNSQNRARLVQKLSFLRKGDDVFKEKFFSAASSVFFPMGTSIAADGSECGQLAIVTSGRVRVYKLSETGREITLYRIEAGDSCVLTASCIMSQMPFPAIAVTETDCEAVVLPAGQVRNWLVDSPVWSLFIFGLISRRLSEVIAVLEDIAFHHVDERVSAYLIARASNSPTFRVTHQQIAADLGTTREVISRILKDFERKGLIKGSRGQIDVLNPMGLQSLIQ